MATRRFELTDSSTNKFWEISIKGATVGVRFGRIGTTGTARSKTHESAAVAKRELEKLVAAKTKKGYVEIGGARESDATKSATSEKTSSKGSTTPAPNAAATVDRLLSAMAKKEPEISTSLLPPASTEALRSLEALGAPEGLLALYTRHDGSEDAVFGTYRLLRIEEALSEREAMSELSKSDRWQDVARWGRDWIPFMSDGDGQFLCIDPRGEIDAGSPGQIVAFDHEVGPAREFESLDILLDLWFSLAKKGLLSDAANGEPDQAFLDAYARAQSVGLAKMPPKELEKIKSELANDELPDERRLQIALPLAQKFAAERDLWFAVTRAALGLQKWGLMARAAAKAEQLTPTRDRPYAVAELVHALHECGRDDEALNALKKGLATSTQYPQTLIPREVDQTFLHRCYVVATAARPKDYRLWLERGKAAPEPTDRAASLRKSVDLSSDEGLVRFNRSLADKIAAEATRLLELDRIATLEGRTKLAALVALAQSETRDEAPTAQETWRLAATTALELRQWKALDRAGDELLSLESMSFEHFKWGEWKLRALFELGREDEALSLLRQILSEALDEQELGTLMVLPFSGALRGSPATDPKTRAFEERSLQVATEVLGANPHAWLGLGYVATDPASARAAFEKVVELTSDPDLVYVPDPRHSPRYAQQCQAEYAALMALKQRAQDELHER